jgi:hypothetical protein
MKGLVVGIAVVGVVVAGVVGKGFAGDGGPFLDGEIVFGQGQVFLPSRAGFQPVFGFQPVYDPLPEGFVPKGLVRGFPARGFCLRDQPSVGARGRPSVLRCPASGGPVTPPAMPAARRSPFLAARARPLLLAALAGDLRSGGRLLRGTRAFRLRAARLPARLSRRRLAGPCAAPPSFAAPAAFLLGAGHRPQVGRRPVRRVRPFRGDLRHQLRGGLERREGGLAFFVLLGFDPRRFGRWRFGRCRLRLRLRRNLNTQFAGQLRPVLRGPSPCGTGGPRRRLGRRNRAALSHF